MYEWLNEIDYMIETSSSAELTLCRAALPLALPFYAKINKGKFQNEYFRLGGHYYSLYHFLFKINKKHRAMLSI
ncbi:hypothetical protein [Xenorhabdus sp. KJ12.1]|uniref:hypothetical protein n=1 Tax=Xenorhabdus sp. KJ12.1 TaxID=1851571 RepID=UPI000C039858|nr:hypothetical protein [Xenorhabdus sp. KJ12.1]PHM72273.1 hypothetical protein Xekj_00551 [Xenorhabdus sp. KJ12.1]